MNFAGFEGFFAFRSSLVLIFGSERSSELELRHREGKDWADSWSWLCSLGLVSGGGDSRVCVGSGGGSILDGLVEF